MNEYEEKHIGSSLVGKDVKQTVFLSGWVPEVPWVLSLMWNLYFRLGECLGGSLGGSLMPPMWNLHGLLCIRAPSENCRESPFKILYIWNELSLFQMANVVY